MVVGRVLLYVHRNRRLIRDGSPGWSHRLSHSAWALHSDDMSCLLYSYTDSHALPFTMFVSVEFFMSTLMMCVYISFIHLQKHPWIYCGGSLVSCVFFSIDTGSLFFSAIPVCCTFSWLFSRSFLSCGPLRLITGPHFSSDLPYLFVVPFLHSSPGAFWVLGLSGSLLVPVYFLTCLTCLLTVPFLHSSAGAAWVLGLPGPAGQLWQEAGLLRHGGARSSHGGSRSQAGETALFLHTSAL